MCVLGSSVDLISKSRPDAVYISKPTCEKQLTAMVLSGELYEMRADCGSVFKMVRQSTS